MRRILEVDDMGNDEVLEAYSNLKSLNLVDNYFLQRALDLCSGGRVLDIGCGTGKMLEMINKKYEKYGIDIDQKLIQIAKQRDKSSNYKIADSNDLPFENDYFDLVMCHSLLHHLEDPTKTISEIERVVNSDGAIFIRDLCRPKTEEDLQRFYLGYLASDYNESNKRLFENSLRSSFEYEQWTSFFPKNISTSQIFFYNVAERPARNASLNPTKRKLGELDFVLKRLIFPIAPNFGEK
jgi:ubiquinone/menaquinone biosynthesis C-methylase UbiE